MKKIIFSLVAMAMMLSACDNSGDQDALSQISEGNLKGKITFEESPKIKNSKTTAIPLTSWKNIKQVQMFLYNADGEIAFSYTVKPTDVVNEFQWSNIPVGEYSLVLVANAKSNTDNVSNSLDGGVTETLFNDYNVRGLKINDNVFIDLKKISLPAKHKWASGRQGYAEVAEVFTAYSSSKVVIKEGQTTDLTSTPLKLLREVSLMRTRFNLSMLPEPAKVHFDTENSCIAIQRLPVGLGLKKGSFEGGIYGTLSDPNRIMVAATGVNTFMTQNPDYGNIVGLTDGFTLWRDIKVLPNAAASEGKTPASNAATSRKYYIIIAAFVDAGYKYADGTIASEKQPVYWYSNINGVFAKNFIREVNITLESAGYPSKPEEPNKEGGLIISIEKQPENWNSNIESEDINI